MTNDSVVFHVLSEDQIQEIVYAALESLEISGHTFYTDAGLELLRKGGAFVSGNRVKIPSYMVERALQTVPHRVSMADSRTGKRVMYLEGNKSYYGTGSDTPWFVDPWTGERVRARYQDVANAAKCIDALPNIDFAMSLGIVQDVPVLTSDRHQFEAMVLNTSKPMVITAHDVVGFADIVHMSQIIAGGEEELKKNPFLILYAEPISPMQHPVDSVNKLLFAADHGIPVVYTPAPMAGTTAPATLAGTLVQGVAESLAGLVLHQLQCPGAPFIMGGVFTVMDMNTTIFSYGAPEFNLLQAGQTDIAHFLKLPIFCTAGCSDSNALDQQAGIEAMFSILVTAMSGGNLIHDVGYIEYGSTANLDMLVMSDEIISMTRRFVRGIEVNPDTLAVETIAAVGPGGHYLGEEHTMRHFRNELWFPELISRERYDDWYAKGALTLGERTHKKTLKILKEHQPEPLPDDVRKKLKEIIASADAKVVKWLK